MGDALAGIKRCDRLSNPGDLPLVHIEIFVDGLSGKKCSAATGTLGELLKTLFGRAIYANRKCGQCSYVYSVLQRGICAEWVCGLAVAAIDRRSERRGAPSGRS
jgi:hypothetical protein